MIAPRQLGQEFVLFLGFFFRYLRRRLLRLFARFEAAKGWLVFRLYRQRGRWAQPFIHTGMAVLIVGGATLAPIIADNYPGLAADPWQEAEFTPAVLSVSALEPSTTTLISDKPRAEIIKYTVQSGDTVSGIAEKFGVSVDTIRWENDLSTVDRIKPGQTLDILPVTGVAHKVRAGESIYSIAKKYEVDAQAIVNWPYNTFTNDETFALAAGQMLIVPDGVRPEAVITSPRYVAQVVPEAGTVAGTGQFVWPAGGTISQRFVWYHKGLDISNRAAPGIAAADGGRVIVAGWPDGWGYGNRVVIDHGNGYQTLYAHLAKIYVSAGQSVSRGQVIGQMGSTGRSSGIHLHFEVIRNGVYLDPLSVLQ